MTNLVNHYCRCAEGFIKHYNGVTVKGSITTQEYTGLVERYKGIQSTYASSARHISDAELQRLDQHCDFLQKLFTKCLGPDNASPTSGDATDGATKAQRKKDFSAVACLRSLIEARDGEYTLKQMAKVFSSLSLTSRFRAFKMLSRANDPLTGNPEKDGPYHFVKDPKSLLKEVSYHGTTARIIDHLTLGIGRPEVSDAPPVVEKPEASEPSQDPDEKNIRHALDEACDTLMIDIETAGVMKRQLREPIDLNLRFYSVFSNPARLIIQEILAIQCPQTFAHFNPARYSETEIGTPIQILIAIEAFFDSYLSKGTRYDTSSRPWATSREEDIQTKFYMIIVSLILKKYPDLYDFETAPREDVVTFLLQNSDQFKSLLLQLQAQQTAKSPQQ